MLVVVVRLQLHDGLFGLERLVGSSSTQSAGGASRRAHGPQPRLDARRRHVGHPPSPRRPRLRRHVGRASRHGGHSSVVTAATPLDTSATPPSSRRPRLSSRRPLLRRHGGDASVVTSATPRCAPSSRRPPSFATAATPLDTSATPPSSRRPRLSSRRRRLRRHLGHASMRAVVTSQQ